MSAGPRGWPLQRGAAAAVLLALLAIFTPLVAQDFERRPYDEKLLRLSEVLGAIHYLRALCDSGEGQIWRDRMNALIEAEGSSAARRAMLTQRFNRGFRTYSRSFRSCTQNAEATNKRFLAEAAELTAGLLKPSP